MLQGSLRNQTSGDDPRGCLGVISSVACGAEADCIRQEVLGRARELLAEGNSVIVTADIRLEGETLRITANDVAALDQAAQQSGGGMRVWLQKTEAVAHIRALLDHEGKGKGRVVLIPRIEADQDVEITLPGGFNLSPRLAQAVKILPEIERVEDI